MGVRVQRVIDLSLPLDEHTQVYPGDPQVSFAVAATIATDGFNLLSIRMGSQNGTNCDAPYHFLETGARIDEIDLSLFTGTGVLIDVRGLPDRSVIGIADVQPHLGRLGPGSLAVFHTGWSAYYRTPRFLNHPYLAPEAIEAILDRGVRTFCLDTLNIDETPDADHPGAGFPVHRLIAAAGGVIVENLTALDEIDFEDPFITVLPLKLTGSDGSPTRAVAMQLKAD